MQGEGTVVGKRAINFVLPDQSGRDVSLTDLCRSGPTLLVFYPGDFRLICTQQLCSYRDNLSQFGEFGLMIAGISQNSPEEHKQFADKYAFGFPLLTDTGREVAKRMGCTSFLMAGTVSRACLIINRDLLILYRYVEPTVLSHRKADELLGVLRDLKKHNLI